MHSRLLERPAGCCPSKHILSAKSARATGDSAASTDPPPPPFRTALLLRRTLRSQRLNSAPKASATAMRSLPGFAISAVFRRAQWVGNPSTKAARMIVPSVYSLCAMASRKCERARAVPDEFRHRPCRFQRLEYAEAGRLWGEYEKVFAPSATCERTSGYGCSSTGERGCDSHNGTEASKTAAPQNLLA